MSDEIGLIGSRSIAKIITEIAILVTVLFLTFDSVTLRLF